MPLTAGTRFGPYEILAPLGVGGMGEVYRAKDTKLDREVAIKVLPSAMAADRERLSRFEREAKVLASLNHPNIAQIHGLEEGALVMELVAGSTLTVPQPLDTALHYARQIAEALEAAHEKGITHRDLKPANIMITPDGVVKILDFGLASVPVRETGLDPSNSPTLTMAATKAGMIMGTAGYMSPEQAAGKPVDKRSDIWSFGVVLWEMITGGKLFDGETVSHTLADVLRAPVDFGKLPPSTPAPIADLVKRCLDRDLKTRLRDIGEARIAIQRYLAYPAGAIESSAPIMVQSAKRAWLPWAVAAALAVALGVVVSRHVQEASPKVIRTSVLPPPKARFVTNSPPAISPDGRKLAFTTLQDAKTMLWIRDLDSLKARSITGTDGAAEPFWSPDSLSIGFSAEGMLKRVDVAGGQVLAICPLEGNPHGASWSNRNIIVFAIRPVSALSLVAASGGTPVQVTDLDEAAGEVAHRLPWFLPDGRHFLFTARNKSPESSAVYVGDLESRQRVLVMKGEGHAAYVPTGGFLVFTAEGLTEAPLMAQSMDLSTFQLKGEPVPVADSVRLSAFTWSQHQFSVSRDGVLVYASGGGSSVEQLNWVDRAGKAVGALAVPPGSIGRPAISPDGKTVAMSVSHNRGGDIWLYDLARGATSRFTFNQSGENSMDPAWSHDGKHLIFFHHDASRSGSLYSKPLAGGSGPGEPLGTPWGNGPKQGRRTVWQPNWAGDGRYIAARVNSAATLSDIWLLPLNPPGEKPRPYLESNANEHHPSIAPSGDWLAYSSDETRRFEIYVQSFPTPGRKYQVSVNGGRLPVWSRDGKELFFIGPDSKMMAAPVKRSAANLEVGTPKALFDSNLSGGVSAGYDVSNDGRFLINVEEQDATPPLTLVVNWQAGLKK